jgi:gas vesicle protein
VEYLFDPKKLISKPYWNCPKCGSIASFGVLRISRNSYSRRCKECWYDQGYKLPEIKKKIIYLDQFAISNMMNSINTSSIPFQKNRIDVYWKLVFEKLDVLCKLQVLVCPDSMTHFSESIIANTYKDIKRMYEHLSQDCTFYDFDTIERFYMCAYAINWKNQNKEIDFLLDVKSIIRGKVNEWQDRIHISVNMGIDEEVINEIKNENSMKQSHIKQLFENWKGIKKFDFEEQYQHEVNSYGKTVAQIYMDHLKNYANKMMLGIPLEEKDFRSTISILVNSIKDSFINECESEMDAFKMTIEFLLSGYVKNIPAHHISALMWTELARRVAVVGQKKIKGSIFNDIRTISNLMPYCDAMFVDKECAEILSEVKTKIKYKTKIFSLRNKDEFLTYLEKLKSDIDGKHLTKIYEVYGEDWPIPYTQMYSKE